MAANNPEFKPTNEVIFSPGFGNDLEKREFPYLRICRGTEVRGTCRLTEPSIEVLRSWLKETSLPGFTGSPADIIDAKALRMANGPFWVTCPILQELGDISIAIIFSHSPSAELVRVLAAMPFAWMQHELYLRAQLIVAEERLSNLKWIELFDEVERRKGLDQRKGLE